MLYQLNYWPKLDLGASPPDPLHALSWNPSLGLRATDSTSFAWLTRFRSFAAALGRRVRAPHASQSLARYLLSLCGVCFRQERQNLLYSSRSDVLRRFFVEL